MNLPTGPKRIDWVKARCKAGKPSVAVHVSDDPVRYFTTVLIEGPSAMMTDEKSCWLVTLASVTGVK